MVLIRLSRNLMTATSIYFIAAAIATFFIMLVFDLGLNSDVLNLLVLIYMKFHQGPRF